MLVVEDDAPARDALCHLFQYEGWHVRVAATLREALAALAQPVDWVVLDLLLPDGDGVEVLTHVRRERMCSRVAIVTGMTDQCRLRAVAELHPDAMFTKPIDFDNLLQAIERVDGGS